MQYVKRNEVTVNEIYISGFIILSPEIVTRRKSTTIFRGQENNFLNLKYFFKFKVAPIFARTHNTLMKLQ